MNFQYRVSKFSFVAIAACTFPAVLLCLGGDKYATITNAQALEMLNEVETDIKENYYDPKLHGFPIEERFNKARTAIGAAKSQDEALLDIAGAVEALGDSHTHLWPPARPYGVDYGWKAEAVGESQCYIQAVREGSDAAAKGLKAGDELLSVNGVKISRQSLGAVEYGYAVFPQSGLHLQVKSPGGAERTIVAMAKVIPGQKIIRHADVMAWLHANQNTKEKNRSSYAKEGDTLFWKLPDFLIDPDEMDAFLDKTRAYRALVLDLRGNPGGLAEAEQKFAGGFFEKDMTLYRFQGRGETKPIVAKTRGSKTFKGKLIVLIDSESGSAAELFARVVQLEKRGTLLGDRSKGAVMESKRLLHAVRLDATHVTQYWTSVTIANLMMADGESLERRGVIPDERILPTADDLETGRDPVLARAAELAGVKKTAEEAGKMFPFEWPRDYVFEMN
jgi:C-terminal processing protease CtpA/Prc